MTTVKNYREYEINGIRYFVKRYAQSPHFTWLWMYGYVVKFGTADIGYKLKDGLRSRPNIKRLFGA